MTTMEAVAAAAGPMTYEQLAAELGVSTRFVKRHAARWPHHRYGRSYRFDADDVAAIKKMHEHRPAHADADQLRPSGRGRRAS